jgi:hypothetical protein
MSAATVPGKASAVAPAHLHGAWLVLARAAWGVLLVATVVLFVIALPTRVAQLRDTALRAERMLGGASSLALPAPLQAALAPNLYPGAVIVLEVMLLGACIAAAVAIFWRSSQDRMALFASVTLVCFGALTSPALDALAASSPLWRAPVSFVQGVGLECELLIFYLSPTGRFVPWWTRPLAFIWTGWRIFALFHDNTRIRFLGAQPGGAQPLIVTICLFLVWLFWISSALYAQALRYRLVSTPMQRQQTKWALIGATAAVSAYVVFVLPPIALPFLSQPGAVHLVYQLVGTPLYLASLLVVPVCIAIAILRYRLWDVDVLINRTLVYGSLTAVLALIYAGGIIGLQALGDRLFAARAALESPLVIVVTTLLIAALFQPLRERIQGTIDQRFYRSKYDARLTLERFAATLRHEVDLPALTANLVAVVEDTMQPTHISLWLKSATVAAPSPRPGEAVADTWW